MSPLILREVSGTKIRWAPLERADLVGVGSLLDSYLRQGARSRVFGSGLRTGTTTGEGGGALEDRIVSVRGHLTRQALALPSSTPVGDPGLVVRGLTRPRSGTRAGTLVLPHFAVLGSRLAREQLRTARSLGMRVVLPNEEPAEVARAIRSTDLLLTSSLHGMVFADALGTPAQLISFETGSRSQEPAFKYADYMSVFDIEPDVRALGDLMRPGALSKVLPGLEERTATISQHVDAVVDTIYQVGRELA